MKYGDKGARVRSAQTRLNELGYDLGGSGVDGVLGEATWDALRSFAVSQGLKWQPTVPDTVLAALAGFEAPPVAEWTQVGDYIPGVRVIDVREHLREPQEKARVVGGKTVMRAPSTVTGITLHQTAVEYHITERLLLAAGGDLELAHALRVQRAACHLMALQEGFVVWTRPLASFVHHGNALNAPTIGIEIEGNYAGVAGNPRTAWSGSAYSGPVTERTILAARKALLVAVTEGRRLGMPIEHLYAHRQSSGTRRNDPGEEIWKGVALDYGVKVLGLVVHPRAAFASPSTGKGRAIPIEWDPQSGVKNY
ncbi:MAG: N-acetylmuramoyl-L-alanine amidase [Sandaracinaceae bacterium]|nr:N-acetylmuramoyl-L-alanine amidase [Sandaracinaceae bacterium]